jgi:hypothetical protein
MMKSGFDWCVAALDVVVKSDAQGAVETTKK